MANFNSKAHDLYEPPSIVEYGSVVNLTGS
jgi:hypothetical protein